MKAFRYRVYPTTAQQVLLAKTFGCRRFVWNYFLGENQKQYELYRTTGLKEDRPKVDLNTLSAKLTKLKQSPEYSWLCEISAVVLQQSLKDLAEAFTQSFKIKGRGLPKFKSKHTTKSAFRVVGNDIIRLKDCQLWLPKAERGLRVKWTRGLPCTPTSYTVSQTPDGKYWVSFVCRDTDPVVTSGTGTVGLDLGLKDFVVDSNGVRYESPKHYRKAQRRLAKAQRVLSRRKKGSRRRQKVKLRVARIHAKIANQRKDYLHKLSRVLVNENQVIGLEDLNVSGLAKNRNLAKSVMDAGFGFFRYCLTYKALESQNTTLVLMDRWYPSTQTCSHCGHRLTGEEKLSLKTREWTCPACGTLHDRDENAAQNICDVAITVFTQHDSPKGCVLLAPALRECTLKTQPAAPGLAQLITCH